MPRWETLSFCVSSHLKTSSWLVPNKPLVNPPVRFVFFFATRRGGLFSLFSLFSLSLSVESKGCFSFACVPRGSFLDSDSKTIRRVLVVHYILEIRLETTTRVWSRKRARRADDDDDDEIVEFLRFPFSDDDDDSSSSSDVPSSILSMLLLLLG